MSRVSADGRWLLLGAVVGLGLGAGARYLYHPGVGGVGVLIPIVTAMVLLLVCLGRALVKRSITPILAGGAMLVALLPGVQFGPDGPGSIQERPGTGKAGTRADSAAIWSGPVTCSWAKGYDRAVSLVSGFAVPVTDPGVLAANDLVSAMIWSIDLPPEGGWVGPDPYGALVNAIAERRADGPWPDFHADLEGLSANGASGTAVSADAGLVLRWECVAGP